MKLTELGFDYSNLSSCTVKRKNYTLAFITIIIGATISIIFITFLVLYILKVPMDFNGDMLQYDDPEYQNFFMPFLSVSGALSLILIILAMYNFIQKPKEYMYVDTDGEMNLFYYILNHPKHEEIYLTKDIAIVKNTYYNNIYTETNKKAIDTLFKKFVFWLNFDNISDYKIKQKTNNTILKIKEKSNSFVTLLKTYRFSNEVNVVPEKVTETINIRAGGNYRTQSMYTFYFDNMNRAQHFEIDPEIKRTLSSNY